MLSPSMRRHEGLALSRVLTARLSEIAALAQRAEAAPGRQPDAIRQRLAEQISTLLEQSERFDAGRLHQEAILIAAKADVREELDRLTAHVEQARGLLAQGGPVGRRLDFLAQELNRETNTLCAKAGGHGAHQHWFGTKGRGGAIPRAGSERGIKRKWRAGRKIERASRAAD